jgi:hypothetical protein
MSAINTSTVSASAFDQAKAEAFAGKVFGDTVGLMVTTMASIGDRLGLFKELDVRGPASSEELAMRASIHERYAREWLGAMATAGYLDFDITSQRFSLPPDHAPALAHEGGPAFYGGVHEELVSLVTLTNQILPIFKSGGGIS